MVIKSSMLEQEGLITISRDIFNKNRTEIELMEEGVIFTDVLKELNDLISRS